MQPEFLHQKCKIEESIKNSVNIVYDFVIYVPNITVSSIILSVFGVTPKIWQEKIVNIPFKIFDVVFLEHELVCQIKLFWLITIDVNKK